MDRNTLVKQVQLNVLERYDVLIDCSKLSDHTLRKLSKRLPKIDDDTTFASWCNQVVGSARPYVAQFATEVSGQTQINKLQLGLRERLSHRQKAQKAEVKQLQKQLTSLQTKQIPVRTHCPADTDDDRQTWTVGWRDFYARPRGMLLSLLDEVKDIEGPHREYQGDPNRAYREEITATVRELLHLLKCFGFDIAVTLVTHEKPGSTRQIVDFYRTSDEHNYSSTLLSFQVDKMPTDILARSLDGASNKSTCHFTLKAGEAEGFETQEIEHLGAFLHKLFAALAKSANYVPRGGLRENLMLSLMLTWSAPGINLGGMASSTPAFRTEVVKDEPIVSRQATDLSPAEIFKHLAIAIRDSNRP